MKYRVTGNGGHTLMRGTSLEGAQAVVLANRSQPVYVRSDCETHAGWVFELIGGKLVVFSWYGILQDDVDTESFCPWMLTLRRAIYRAVDVSTPE